MIFNKDELDPLNGSSLYFLKDEKRVAEILDSYT